VSALVPGSPPVAAVRLGSVGQVYVTVAAAGRYAAFAGMKIEGARRELTVLLLDAKRVRDGEPSHWRARSRTTGLDISATVTREGPLLVVLSCNVREA
jgi:hypothetical protein